MLLYHKFLTLYGQAFPFVKVFHVTFVIFLIAGILYLPRLFAYHVAVDPSSQAATLFCEMESKLMRRIIHPAWAVVVLSGSFLLILPIIQLVQYGFEVVQDMVWLVVKLSCVLVLMVYYGLCMKWKKDIERNVCTHTSRFFRVVNEIPALLTFIIVFMVIVKPWA